MLSSITHLSLETPVSKDTRKPCPEQKGHYRGFLSINMIWHDISLS